MLTDAAITKSVSFLNFKGLNPFIRCTKGINFKAVIFLFIETVATLSIALSIFVGSHGLSSFMDSVTGLICASQIICKQIILLVCQDDFIEVVDYLKEFWAVDKYGQKAAIQIDAVHSTTARLLKTFRYVLAIATIAFLVKPFLEEELALPVSWLSVCSIHTSTICYNVNYIIQCFYIGDLMCSLVIFDELFFTLLTYGYCELEQVKYAFSNLIIKNTTSENEVNIMLEIVIIIQHHSRALEYIDRVDKLFNLVLLCQFSTSVFAGCMGLFVLTYEGLPPKLNTALKNIPYVFGVLFQVFIYCVAGQKIAEQSESIADMAYNSKWWIKYRPQMGRAVCLIMQRAYKRKQITAGGVWNLDMITFVAIVKGSLSLLAFVQALCVVQ